MSQIKLQSLIFLCPVCNITKYVNIQKYINNILNVNKHKLTCPLCINNYTGINNLIIHIITDHKTLLTVNDGNVSVNLNNFVGNHIITNVESVCGDLKIRESLESVNQPLQSDNSTNLKTSPYLQAFTLNPNGINGGSSGETNAPSGELVILESLTSESYVTQTSTPPVECSEEPRENPNHCPDVFQHEDADAHNDPANASFIPVRPDSKVPEEMCFIDNSFCDRFLDDKFKDNSDIDGLKFDIDQFLNEMSNTNSFSGETNPDTSSDIQHDISMDVKNPPVNGEAIVSIKVPMESVSEDDRNKFIWDEVNSVNQLFNMNQINLLQTNVILKESIGENHTEHLDPLFIQNTRDSCKPMQEDAEDISQGSQLKGITQIDKTNPIVFDSPSKSFQSAFYENVFQIDETGTKRLKSEIEIKPNRLKLFREKQNRSKNQRLKKLQFLTMNKKFEEHFCLDEAPNEPIDASRIPSSTNSYEAASLRNETDHVSNKRQNENIADISCKYARTLDSSETPAETAHLQETVLFKCEACNFLFQNADILAMHNQLLHNIQEEETKTDGHRCEYCSRVFKMKGSLMIHLKVAHSGLSSRSTKLPSLPETSPDLVPSSASPQSFTCSLCSKTFKKEPHLLQHLKTHEGKQWECKLCSKLFTTKYFLKKHNRLHTGEMPYKCSLCERSFTFQQSFHKHLLYHSDEKPHVCTQCGRAFKELSTLHNHERIHSGEKPFCCEICGKSFRQRVSYLVHQRIHTGVTPYKCSACHKTFRYKISDKMHKCSFGVQGRIVKTESPLIEKLLARSRAVNQVPAVSSE